MASSSNKFRYVYDLPYLERSEICKILNQNDKWEELAGLMGYDVSNIQSFRKEQNPMDELLINWGHHNHTIEELFVLLSIMKHYQAMVPLKDFVDSKYHPLLYNGEGNLKRLFRKEQDLQERQQILKFGVQNFNQDKIPDKNKPKVFKDNTTDEKVINDPNHFERPNELPSHSNNLLASIPEIFSTMLPRIPYNDLAAATDNWKRENLLGKGGFGIVFKGIWKNTEVAVKKIEPRGSDYDESYALQLEQSFREIKILNSLPHENILPLYAYSLGGEAPCLVYQCMTNGSVEDRLHLRHGTKPLTWPQRQEIAKGTARGLQYLHTIHEKPLIHGDIKSANILLDKNFEPKIGDFGLAREGSVDASMKVSKIQGTRPYLPEEYIFGRSLSTKIDTYSYGIVLFELGTGLSAYDKTRPINKRLKDFVDGLDDKGIYLLKDKNAEGQYDEVFIYLMSLGKWCSNKLAQHRPEMAVVYEKFKN